MFQVSGGIVSANSIASFDASLSGGVASAPIIQDTGGAKLENGNIDASGVLFSPLINTSDVSNITVNASIIPSTEDVSIGSDSLWLQNLYAVDCTLSQDTLYVGDAQLSSSEGTLIVSNLKIVSTKIVTEDESELYSIPDPGSPEVSNGVLVSTGDSFVSKNLSIADVMGDFDTITGIETDGDQTDSITCSYSYGIDHSWKDLGYSWNVYHSVSNILAPALDGAGISTVGMTVVATGSSPSNMRIPVNGVYNGMMYVMSGGAGSIAPEQVTNVNSYIPDTFEFAGALETDVLACLGTSSISVVTGYTLVPVDSTIRNKSYLVAYVAVYLAPLFTSNIIDAHNAPPLLAPISVEHRLTRHYAHAGAGSYSTVDDPSGSGIFPWIGYSRWANSATGCNIAPSVYRPALGWGEDTASAYSALSSYGNNAEDWILELFRRTYIYVRYGNAEVLPLPTDAHMSGIVDLYHTYCRDVVGHNLRMTYATIGGKNTIAKVSFSKDAFTFISV
jgi:hypothetical protein